MTRKSNRLNSHVEACQGIVRQQLCARRDTRLDRFRLEWGGTAGRELSETGFLDTCSEALAWLLAYAELCHKDGLDTAFDRLSVYSPFVVESLHWLRSASGFAPIRDYWQGAELGSPLDPILLYERYLAERDPRRRLELGAYYTPRVIARHIVERVDLTLREQFELPDGLADTTTWSEMQRRCPAIGLPQDTAGDDPFVRILDPAAGTGIFLVEMLDRIHRTMLTRWREQGYGEEAIVIRWNEYVPRHLLPRVFAVELMPTAGVIAQLAFAQKLAETGYTFHANQPLRLSIADTLLDPATASDLVAQGGTQDAAVVASGVLSRTPFTIVLGNPPFRGISSNRSRWIGELLRGKDPNGQPAASYYAIGNEPLRERKHWLQDDYVKFMRFAQWQIERAGAGLVGFVTNHGYLDNATFRAMRHAMLQTFQRIEVFDLHGNRKKNKAAPDGGVDESMFDIEQGIAIGIFSRTKAMQSPSVFHREIWGKRDLKTKVLAHDEQVPQVPVDPSPPHYLFVPTRAERHPEYEAGFALNDLMPVNSTAVVTARDSFVVDFDEARLAERMRVFCDPSVPDAEIRRRFFTNSRSTRYPPGDTRGWKLVEARRRMQHEVNRSDYFRPCLYRPFDRRVIFWAEWMIDWPRQDVTRHMLGRSNLALVARRQMPPTGSCNYFWITNTIALDGLIRSDNRGSESIFPLWLNVDSSARDVNLAPPMVDAIASKLGLIWETGAAPNGDNLFGPTDVVHFIYALFNTPTYRRRYHEPLRRDFPRVLVPNRRSIWQAFCDLGERLAKLHLHVPTIARWSSDKSSEVLRLDAGYPKFVASGIQLGEGGPVVAASQRVWDFHVGTHQVCRKWLRDRKVLGTTTIRQYEMVISAISKTIELTDRLDRIVVDAGGWEAVFST